MVPPSGFGWASGCWAWGSGAATTRPCCGDECGASTRWPSSARSTGRRRNSTSSRRPPGACGRRSPVAPPAQPGCDRLRPRPVRRGPGGRHGGGRAGAARRPRGAAARAAVDARTRPHRPVDAAGLPVAAGLAGGRRAAGRGRGVVPGDRQAGGRPTDLRQSVPARGGGGLRAAALPGRVGGACRRLRRPDHRRQGLPAPAAVRRPVRLQRSRRARVAGSARLPLGIAAGTTGRLDDAVRHLRAAAEVNERTGLPRSPPTPATSWPGTWPGVAVTAIWRRRRPW